MKEHLMRVSILTLLLSGVLGNPLPAQNEEDADSIESPPSSLPVSVTDIGTALKLENIETEDDSATTDQPKKEEETVQIETRNKGLNTLFKEGNAAYERDDLEEAAAYYEAILDREVENGDVYFNLGNAYFRKGDFGRAVLYYEKARKLRPRDADLVHNLAYVQTFLIDEPIKRAPSSLDTLLILHWQTTFNETLWMLVLLNLCLIGLMVARVLDLGFARTVYFGYLRGVVVTLFVLQLASAGEKIWAEKNLREGVILTDAVSAKASPTSEEVLVEINSGTKVDLLDSRNGFAHIRLPNGIPAYIPDTDIAEI